MGLMPDNLWRRTIELFLLAGELDQGGLLPPCCEIAWRLHQSQEIVENDLEELKKRHILKELDGGIWFVINFARRQSKVSDSERQRRYRDRQHPDPEKERMQAQTGDYRVLNIRKRNVTYTVTICNSDVTQITDTDIDITTTTSEIGLKLIDVLCRANFSDLQTNPAFIEVLKRDLKEYSWQDVLEAILIAVSPERSNGRPKTWGYVQGILKKGVNSPKPESERKYGHYQQRSHKRNATAGQSQPGATDAAIENDLSELERKYQLPSTGSWDERLARIQERQQLSPAS
jgi:hypothetical protein